VTKCARGCCFTGLNVCGKQRACLCHVDDLKPPPKGSDARSHNDPTANEAIRNIMKGTKK
jgi:hypothetical protein